METAANKEIQVYDNAGNQLRKLTRAINQLGSTVIFTDRNGAIEYVNPRFTELTGYSADEVIGKNPRILQSGKTPQGTYAEMWQAMLSGKVWTGELLNKKKDGSLYWGKLTVGGVKDANGLITHFAGVEEDITESKELSEKLRLSNLALEKANEALREFSSIAAHDLRSPLNTIISGINLLERDLAGKLNPDLQELMDAIREKTRGMCRLVQDLLDYARVGATSKAFSLLDTRAVVRRVVENLAALVESRKAQITVSELPAVRSHETLLTQLFQNLIENGIKYNKGAVPKIDISCTELNDSFEFCIKDNGIGITAGDIPNLFRPFQRVATGFQGTGIGLASCKKIVELHGGVIWVESEPGMGSSFMFRLPK